MPQADTQFSIEFNIVEIFADDRRHDAREGSFALAYPLSRRGFDSHVASL
jgi:hypothetical protein